ncbi:TPA: adenylyl-sulfate kinase [Campylobacter jejuni]|nr:adenylyl-sulfate kinase [Campylobacter jejuni]
MVIAVIPARSGSKGIKNKNLVLLNNQPLIYYTIKAALNSKCISKVLVSSDSEEILSYAKSQNVDILKRPIELAQDDTTSDKVLLHALEFYKDYEDVIFLQPTSPLRTNIHIDEAFNIYKNSYANALISVTECDNKILKAFVCDNEGNLKGICNDEYPFMPRQKLPKTYMSNGAIYILSIKDFFNNPSFLQSKTKYFLMNKISSLDIDNLEDLKQVENIQRMKGCVIWISGLAGAGKTTISSGLYKKLKEKYNNSVLLDGDELRKIFKHTGYTREKRLESAKKISSLCSFLAKNDIIVICATISLFEEIYLLNRNTIENYFEVFVDCPMEELILRDQKGLYSGALKGEIKDVVGVDIKYTKPNAHYVIDNSSKTDLEKKINNLYNEVELFFNKER